MAKSKTVAEFGDFQTPAALAADTCSLIARSGIRPATIIEPTCGRGAFLFAAADVFPDAKLIGVEINKEYVAHTDAIRAMRPDASRITVVHGDFFSHDWQQMVRQLTEPVLILGNPPWVTSSHLGSLGSQNLPTKTNFQNRSGLDAVTGKANFDISEWMMIQFLEWMRGRDATLAMLCKTAVARKVLFHAWSSGISLDRTSMSGIDAMNHFGAAVDATLLITHFTKEAPDRKAIVHKSFDWSSPAQTIAHVDGLVLADLKAFERWKHLRGTNGLKWRSGVKHDCSKVMELALIGGKLFNGLEEEVDLEHDYVFPMLKSSDVATGKRAIGSRMMIVTQREVGEDTAGIEHKAPKTWNYLVRHEEVLGKRGSSIYKKRPPFSIFGVGDYTYAPFKVAISGFYKRLAFTKVGNVDGKPIVLDDTSYFVACKSDEAATLLLEMLNSTVAREFFTAFIFWDAKRPITVDVLGQLDLFKLAAQLGRSEEFSRHFGEQRLAVRKKSKQKSLPAPLQGAWTGVPV